MELAITMVFAAHEDTLIWPTAIGSINGTDPFYSINPNANACIATNQSICDTFIRTENYDIGHVFTTGAGGLSLLQCVCNSATKAQSATGQPAPVGDGFDINYVAHEIGHEFGSDHTFNDNIDGSCSTNAVQELAYEPGSGTTIMAYAGICAPDDIQLNSDAYFCASSLLQINNFITHAGDACPVKSNSLNLPVHLDSFTRNYSIPYLTPFELTAPIAVDSASADTLNTYCWEQWNLGDFGYTFAATHKYGPIFRSFSPTPYSSTRVFPKIEHVIANYLNDAGHENDQGEKVPDSVRYLTFKLTVRDIFQGKGCFLFPDDSIHLDVINTGAGFTVSSQNTTGITYNGGSSQTILWNVVNTVSPPINTPYVDIYMSIDGGYLWTYHLGTFPNNGSAFVTIPNPPDTTTSARFKVKGTNNVFFNVNTNNFTVNYNPTLPVSTGVKTETAPTFANDISIFPVPTKGELNINCTVNSTFLATICNALGQKVWAENINQRLSIPTNNWQKGVYYLMAVDSQGSKMLKKFVVE